MRCVGIGMDRVFFVLDGCESVAKRGTNIHRHEKRKRDFEDGIAKLEDGDLNGADPKLMGSSRITYDDKRRMMEYILADVELRGRVIPFFSPFQADSQLVYMILLGIIKAVAANDLDLLAAGCKNLFSHNDFAEKCGQVVDFDVLFDSSGPPPETGLADLRGFDLNALLLWCSMTEHDYGPGFRNLGPVRLLDIITKARDDNGVIIEKRTPLEALQEARALSPDASSDAEVGALTFVNQVSVGGAMNMLTGELVAAGQLGSDLKEAMDWKEAMDAYGVTPYAETETTKLTLTTKDVRDIAVGALNPMTRERTTPLIAWDALFAPPPAATVSDAVPDEIDVDTEEPTSEIDVPMTSPPPRRIPGRRTSQKTRSARGRRWILRRLSESSKEKSLLPGPRPAGNSIKLTAISSGDLVSSVIRRRIRIIPRPLVPLTTPPTTTSTTALRRRTCSSSLSI